VKSEILKLDKRKPQIRNPKFLIGLGTETDPAGVVADAREAAEIQKRLNEDASQK